MSVRDREPWTVTSTFTQLLISERPAARSSFQYHSSLQKKKELCTEYFSFDGVGIDLLLSNIRELRNDFSLLTAEFISGNVSRFG